MRQRPFEKHIRMLLARLIWHPLQPHNEVLCCYAEWLFMQTRSEKVEVKAG